MRSSWLWCCLGIDIQWVTKYIVFATMGKYIFFHQYKNGTYPKNYKHQNKTRIGHTEASVGLVPATNPGYPKELCEVVNECSKIFVISLLSGSFLSQRFFSFNAWVVWTVIFPRICFKMWLDQIVIAEIDSVSMKFIFTRWQPCTLSTRVICSLAFFSCGYIIVSSKLISPQFAIKLINTGTLFTSPPPPPLVPHICVNGLGQLLFR